MLAEVASLKKKPTLQTLTQNIHACTLCSRLRKHCLTVAHEKRRAFQNEKYWGKPISGFGDPEASLIVIGLAPAAHGANRTGRIFTGDQSGFWLYRALHKAEFANQAESIDLNDGLKLKNAWVTCAVKCAPPQNKPTPKELQNCVGFLGQELDLLSNKKIFLVLGKFAFDTLWPILKSRSLLREPKKPKFSHGLEVQLAQDCTLLASFHPSQQNTFTKRLTEPMFDAVFKRARKLI